MGSSPLDLYAREYFRSLNYVAEKISADISTTVAAYEDLWHTLSIKDQHQVINETIIHPEVVLKYSLCRTEDDNNLKERLLSQSYCNDESKGIGISWSDEHAAPFSWKTQSQQDLSVFCDGSDVAGLHSDFRRSWKPAACEKLFSTHHDTFIDHPNIVLGGSSSKLTSTSPTNLSCTDNKNFLDKMKSKSVVLKIQPMKLTSSKSERNSSQNVIETNSSVTKMNVSCKVSKTLPSRLVSKPKNPPPPPPKLKQIKSNNVEPNNRMKVAMEEQPVHVLEKKQSALTGSDIFSDSLKDFHVDINTSMKSDGLPKTGFDFLDNW